MANTRDRLRASLGMVLQAANAVTAWDWSGNDEECVADMRSLAEVAGNVEHWLRHEEALETGGESDVALNGAYASGRGDQLDEDRELLRWAYHKLRHVSFSKQEDAMQMDAIEMALGKYGPDHTNPGPGHTTE